MHVLAQIHPLPWDQPYTYRIVQSHSPSMSQAKGLSSYMAKQGSTEPNDTAPKLLFINKDASNLSRTSVEVYAVGSHVSKGSRKWQRTKSSLELDLSTGRILAAAGLDTSDVSRTSSSTQGKPSTLRWRSEDGCVISTKTVGSNELGTQKSKAVKSATTPPPSIPLSMPPNVVGHA